MLVVLMFEFGEGREKKLSNIDWLMFFLWILFYFFLLFVKDSVWVVLKFFCVFLYWCDILYNSICKNMD